MQLIEITSTEDSRVKEYVSLTEAQLRMRLEPSKGLFIAESPKVISVALDMGYEPISILCERKHIEGDAKDIILRCGDIPVYTAPREILSSLTGYVLTRGVLCAMRRKEFMSPGAILEKCSRVVVIDNVSDTTNIGAIFRSAAALGMDAVLLTKDSCDPLNRRAIRVSMGSVFLIPWTWIDNLDVLHENGFKTVAMALRDDSVDISDERLRKESRLAIIMGAEGYGLPQCVIDSADYTVKIPMYHNVDSLNVAAASAVAFWELGKRL